MSLWQRFKQRHVYWCSICWGTGWVFSYVDEETGQDYSERCDECDGPGHFDVRNDEAVTGPCFKAGCMQCSPESRNSNADVG